MRRLNNAIKKNFKKEFKLLNIKIIYKIVEGFEEQFKEKPIVESDVSEYCMSIHETYLGLKNELL